MKTFTFSNKMLKKSTALAVVGSLLFSFVPPYVQAFNQSSKPESYKLRKQVLTSNLERTEDTVVRLAQSKVPPDQLPIMLNRYQDGLKRSGARRRSASSPRLSGTHFRLASVRQSVTSLTALHVGPLLMQVRKIHENYSLFNIPQSFAYLFRAALDGNKDQEAVVRLRYTVRPAKKDGKWEFIREMDADNSYLLPRFLTRVMKAYKELWKVDFHKVKTVGDYEIAIATNEEKELVKEFNLIYKELIDNDYEHLGLDEVYTSFYDGPGFIWDEDNFQLAYFYIHSTEMSTVFQKASEHYNPRKDENWYRYGVFPIDRRYGRILIEYGKKYGMDALRSLMRTHAERELLAQTNVRVDGQKTTFDKAHNDLLDFPGQKELVEFATRAANDIRLGDFSDYIFVRDLVDTMNSKNGFTPENTIGIFGDYLQYHYFNVKEGRDQSGISSQILNDVFLLIRRDKELYLEYKARMEELLSRRAGESELESLRQAFMQYLKEKERERLVFAFSVRNPRFTRIFGREMVESNLEALLEFERKVEEFGVKKRRTPGNLSFIVFQELFREVEGIVTSENMISVGEDIFKLVQMYAGYVKGFGAGGLSEIRERLDWMMEYFGPKRALKKFHSMVEFARRTPFGWSYFDWRVRIEEHLRWLHPDTYARMKKQKEEDSKKHWMQRVREKHLETWFSWILFFVTFSAGAALADDGTVINAFNEVVNSIVTLLPYLTVGLVSVAYGAPFDGVRQQLPAANTAYSPKNAIEEAVIDIGEKAGDPEEVVREILTPSLDQALSGIVRQSPVRVFLNRSDLNAHGENLKRLLDQNEGERKFAPVITINRESKEIEKAKVEKELRDHGIDPKQVEIIDQPMTWDGKFSLRALLLEHEEFLSDGYSMWVLNRESWIDLVFQVIDKMRLDSRVDLVELDMKGDHATKLSQ